MVDFIKILEVGYFCIDLYGVWQILPHVWQILPPAVQVYAKWLNFNKSYKINSLELGLHTLNLSCLGN